MNEVQTRSEAAAVLGRIKTKAKADAARENGKLGGRPKGNSHDRRKQKRKHLKAQKQAKNGKQK